MSRTLEQRFKEALDSGELAGKTWEEIARMLEVLSRVLRKIEAKTENSQNSQNSQDASSVEHPK